MIPWEAQVGEINLTIFVILLFVCARIFRSPSKPLSLCTRSLSPLDGITSDFQTTKVLTWTPQLKKLDEVDCSCGQKIGRFWPVAGDGNLAQRAKRGCGDVGQRGQLVIPATTEIRWEPSAGWKSIQAPERFPSLKHFCWNSTKSSFTTQATPWSILIVGISMLLLKTNKQIMHRLPLSVHLLLITKMPP